MKNNIKTLQILWKNIKPRRQKQLFFLFLLMLISAFCELMSLALILPFLEILNNSDSLNNSDYFRYLPFNTEILDATNFCSINIVSKQVEPISFGLATSIVNGSLAVLVCKLVVLYKSLKSVCL